MKIMIVDTNVEEKYFDIIKELEKREYEILIVQAVNTAMCEIVMDAKNTIKGIIIGMDIPIKKDEETIHKRGGEELLKLMSREDITEIPVLIFSENETQYSYIQVFDKMKTWEEKKKFFDFLETIQERQL